MDTNHDGRVSFEEAKRVFLESLYRNYPDADASVTQAVVDMFTEMFHKMDTNHDGYLDMSELKKIAMAMYGYK